MLCHRRPVIAGAALLLGLGAGAAPASAEAYIRVALGHDWSQDAAFFDRNCASTRPPALFGCVVGDDGRPLGARGDFGHSVALEAGLGSTIMSGMRGELLVSWRPGFRFSGNANFLAAGQPQPVSAELETFTGLFVAYLDLGTLLGVTIGTAEPFIGAGAGVSRHRISRVVYGFPGLAPGATTSIAGGTTSTFTYMLSAGLAVPLSEQLSLEVAWRYLDFGSIRTDPGPAVITRPAGTFVLDIAGTRADLTSHGIAAGVRYAF